MRAILVSLLSIGSLVFIPISIIVLPVREPYLFGIGIHALQIESTIVSKECLETLVVMTSQIVY